MKLDINARGGRLVTVSETTRTDRGICGERLVAIGDWLTTTHDNGAKIIDARGRYMIPGGGHGPSGRLGTRWHKERAT